MAEVKLENVTKRFGDVIAVNNVNLEIKDKEFIVLVGPSGCGKTTTLRMIAGLEEVTSGNIYIDGKVVNDVPPKDRDIAMVFQNYALYPHMTVYDNMAFGLKLRKYPKSEIDRRVKAAAEMLGIENLLKRKPKELSGGQRQRVALGRAIVREPKVFLMDEPLSNLDAKLRVQMRAELKKLQRTLGVTTIYVTHDQTEAMTMGDRIVVMKDGVVQQVDDPLIVYEKPNNVFVAGFIGSPPMNFIDATLSSDAKILDLGSFKLGIPADMQGFVAEQAKNYLGKKVILGVRPEHIYEVSLIKTEDLIPEAVADMRVEVLEPMGTEVYLYLINGPVSVVARVGSETKARMGENVKVMFDLRKMHLFDPVSQVAII
ncbi:MULTISPECIES: ABC transporter ATP-binding protein [Dictyoglomus]|jgi:multiple sugar transport system ATP-binding protein|uniref:ABC transporter related n=1 Tax=Dictyoglomus turgidum (strain DSM 6724 / Z-1310) TaxID=515635 RepID=B8E147_DICTD|nr:MULTISPECIES: sn-glycerol-3-phosphate ABC transporter ATP-binding protein UgpC [Dictyoglomus]ACK42175.1 ABC transporter related [Dictyoglomus turgidum DSM 6724]PNV81038.1 MAG: ABC transporter ATP-binding protein [Dictyoglomus turgidum]HBU32405.1 ABC transporter ATP-binding protein [Dictyoglomus sp.]